MTTNAVAAPAAAKVAVPAHLQDFFGFAPNKDLAGGVGPSFPVVSIKGKVWTIVENGQRNLVQRDDGNGEMVPASYIEVILIKANKDLSKIYYPDGYEEGSDTKPVCFSNDSVRPDPSAEQKQHINCKECPRNVWGSRITENGKKGKECSDARRVAIAPAGQPEKVMLLRVPAGSLRDLADYGSKLEERGIPYPAVVTRLSFDHTVAHQKLVFAPKQFITAEQAAKVREVMQSDIVASILGMSMADEVAADTPAAPPVQTTTLPPAAPAPAPAPAAAPTPAPAPTAAAPAQPAKGRGRGAKAAPAPAPVTQAEVQDMFAGFSAPEPAPTPAPAAATPVAPPPAPAANMAGAFDDFLASISGGATDDDN